MHALGELCDDLYEQMEPYAEAGLASQARLQHLGDSIPWMLQDERCVAAVWHSAGFAFPVLAKMVKTVISVLGYGPPAFRQRLVSSSHRRARMWSLPGRHIGQLYAA